MKLKNSRDMERNVELVLKIEKDNNTYLVYHDLISNNIYGGKLKNKKLKSLKEEEVEYVNNVLERICG